MDVYRAHVEAAMQLLRVHLKQQEHEYNEFVDTLTGVVPNDVALLLKNVSKAHNDFSITVDALWEEYQKMKPPEPELLTE